jgi:hypothetical protein
MDLKTAVKILNYNGPVFQSKKMKLDTPKKRLAALKLFGGSALNGK